MVVWNTEVPVPANDAQGRPALHRDEHGRLAVAIDFDGGDAEDRALARLQRMTETGVSYELNTASKARQLLKKRALFEKYGAKEPQELTDAAAVWAAVDGLTVQPKPANVMVLGADEIGPAIAEMLDQEVKIQSIGKIRDELIVPAATRVARAFYNSTDVALSAIKDRFDDAAKRFVEAYGLVQGCLSITDAAHRDTDGTTVAAWHRAKAAANELTELTQFPMSVYVFDNGVSRALNLEHPEPRYTIGAEIAHLDFVVDPSNPTFKTDDRPGVYPPKAPLGIWAHLVDIGAELALPTDAAGWHRRTSEYLGR